MIESRLTDHCQRYSLNAIPGTIKLRQSLLKLLAGSPLPPGLFYREYRKDGPLKNKNAPIDTAGAENTANQPDTLSLEIVSHCWRYTHYLAFQLGSLIANPPDASLTVTMTVFHAAEDSDTVKLLERVSEINVPNIQWNWQALPPPYLFRRSIGRNLAALCSTADWVWFTDCDETFQQGCLEALAKTLGSCKETLVYPETEFRTAPLDDEALQVDLDAADWVDQVTSLPLEFFGTKMTRATGPLQITRGDIARHYGYCDAVECFQYPENSWAKAHEDRVFRWLLGTPGTALEIPGVFRIQHVRKGRQDSSSLIGRFRQRLRHRRYSKARHSDGTRL